MFLKKIYTVSIKKLPVYKTTCIYVNLVIFINGINIKYYMTYKIKQILIFF